MATTISLQEYIKICNQLVKVIEKSFGPAGQLAFLLTGTGHAEFTTSGIRIIDSLCLTHPVAKMIQQTLQKCHSKVGDGSKTFILLLNELFVQISELNNEFIFSNSTRFKLIHGFSLFLHNILPRCFQTVRYRSQCLIPNITENTSVIIPSLLETFFSGKFGMLVSELLSKITCNFLIKYCGNLDNFIITLQYAIDHFDVICTAVGSSKSLSESQILSGIILTRDFTVKCDSNPGSSKLMVCLNNSEDQTPEPSLLITKNQQVHQLLETDFCNYVKAISEKQKQLIKIIICTGTVPEMIQNLCRIHNISLVIMTPLEEVEHLLLVSQIKPVYNLLEPVTEENCGIVNSVESIQVGNKSCIHLDLTSKLNSISPHHLLLHGPTEKICKQYLTECLNSLKLLHFWKQNENKHNLSSIKNDDVTFIKFKGIYKNINELDDKGMNKPLPTIYIGGGCWEIDLHHAIANLDSSGWTVELLTASKILAKSLLVIPRTLNGNSSEKRNCFTNILNQITEQLNSNKSCYFNKWGELQSSKESNVFEPVVGKEFLICNVIQLVIQLLHLENIISVRKLPDLLKS